MDKLINLNIDMNTGLNIAVGIMVKVGMVFLLILSFITVRQESLMDKVVNIPLGRNFKRIVWSFLVLTVVLTAIVILV
jgi:hypothetical protein